VGRGAVTAQWRARLRHDDGPAVVPSSQRALGVFGGGVGQVQGVSGSPKHLPDEGEQRQRRAAVFLHRWAPPTVVDESPRLCSMVTRGRGEVPAKMAESAGGWHSPREGERWSGGSKSGMLGGGLQRWGGQMAPERVGDGGRCSVSVTFARTKEVE
jgi:hypothetical protein